MEGVSKSEVVNFLKSLNLPESKFLIDGEILDIFTLLKIEPQFHKDGTRVLTPYEIIGMPPKFSSDAKEIPIVFVIKNRCKKIGKYEGKTKEFICKNSKVKESRDTLEELKIKYKRAVLNGEEETASELFAIIDKLSGGNAREMLSSFFNYAKFYKKMQKQLLIDMFAHFFMMYIYARVKAAKGGIVRKNRIYKPFKTSFVQTQSIMPTQSAMQTPLNEMQINSMPVQAEPSKVEVLSVNDIEKDGFSPESFGIKNLKSITIEHNLNVEDEVMDVPQQTQPIVPVMPIIDNTQIKNEEVVNNKPLEPEPKTKIQPASGELVKKESKGIVERIVDFFCPVETEDEYLYETPQNTDTIDNLESNVASIEENADNLNLGFMEDEYGSDLTTMMGLDNENSLSRESVLEDSASIVAEEDDGESNINIEIERESELKSKKHVTIKRYGAEFNTETKETKVEKSSEDEPEIGQEYDFEG